MIIKTINTYLSVIGAVIVSIFTIKGAKDLWIPIVAFICLYLALFLLTWLVIAVVSLTINIRKEYSNPSKFYSDFFNFAYSYLFSLAGAKVVASGLEKVPDNEKFVIISNHRSNFDNMIQSYELRKYPIAYISKPENFYIPMGRRFMKRCCYLSIDRNSPLKSLETINKATELVKSGATSVGIFPEGHRSKSTQMGDFKGGFMRIAINSGSPIVVTTITGTEKIHKNFPFRKTVIRFDVVDVIYPTEIKGISNSELSNRIKNIMIYNIEKEGVNSNGTCTIQSGVRQ